MTPERSGPQRLCHPAGPLSVLTSEPVSDMQFLISGIKGNRWQIIMLRQIGAYSL
jgi:hypothetical protein